MRQSYSTLISTMTMTMLLASSGCVHKQSARKPVKMVAVPPPETPHAAASVPAGGATSFDADQVVSCVASVPNLVRAFATKESLVVIGDNPGQTWIRLRLTSGDEFLLDMTVTNEAPPYFALALGEQVALPLEGVKEFTASGTCVRLEQSADATHLLVYGESPCASVITVTMTDGTTKQLEVVVIGGQRLL